MNAEVDLEITGLAHDGRGIARLGSAGGGLAVFVSGALPGMLARCRVTRKKKNFAEAAATRILRPLANGARICRHAGICGGCPLMPMPYEDQLAWKEKLILESMRRLGGIAPDDLRAIWSGIRPSPAVRAMRNKMEFAFSGSGASLELGLRRAASHTVIPVPECMLMPPEAAAIVRQIRNLAAELGLSAHDGGRVFLRSLTLRRGLVPGAREMRYFARILTGPGGAPETEALRTLGRRLMSSSGLVAGFVHESGASRGRPAAARRRLFSLGSTELELPLAGRRYRLDLASFFQVNTGAAQILAAVARSMLPARRGGALLDLFCGVGAPGQALADHFDSVLGIESDRRAIAMARLNAAGAGLGQCRYEAGDAAGAPGKTRSPLACALADPPRQGLPPPLIRGLAAGRSAAIIYISCNPATLARDVAALKDAYVLRGLAAVDLFPHTAHAECVARLDAIDGTQNPG